MRLGYSWIASSSLPYSRLGSKINTDLGQNSRSSWLVLHAETEPMYRVYQPRVGLLVRQTRESRPCLSCKSEDVKCGLRASAEHRVWRLYVCL